MDMMRYKLLAAALLASAAMPAAASVIVVGNTDARLCYEAADSPLAAERQRRPALRRGAAATTC